jgi:NAD(P)-dependent dehydrogenase (short-subunit alcohol dehydrogenase family)
MARLENKVAIVTGSARGIGAAFAKGLAREGAKVLLADILDGSAVASAIGEDRAEAIFMETDVSSPPAVATMVATALDRFGRIDILVNSAAILSTIMHKRFFEITSLEWDHVIAVNLRGTFECAKAVVPAMRRQGGGKIITMASGTVFKGTPMMLHYVTSKGGVVAFTRALARELGPDNIQVNAIAPGLTKSDGVNANPSFTKEMFEANRLSRALQRDEMPADLVGAMLFLASSDSDFMTGQTLVVDGGSAMH